MTTEQKVREIVVKGLDDPWGAPVAKDVVDLLVKDVTRLIREAREEALEQAARLVEDGANGTAGRDTRYQVAEEVRKLKEAQRE